MGNQSCNTCNCAQLFEKKNELDLKNLANSNGKLGYEEKSQKSSRKVNREINYDIIKPFVPKIKALWLGYTARKSIVHLKRQTKPNHNYFSYGELFETLSNKVTMPEFRQKKKAFKYSSGGIYTGQWCGGFRDGFGTME